MKPIILLFLLSATALGQNLTTPFYSNISSSTQSIIAALELDGAVRGISANSDETQATTGGIGLSLNKEKSWHLAIQININSTIDTLSTEYGGSLLNPFSGESLQNGLVDYHRYSSLFSLLDKERHGYHFYLFASSNIWEAKMENNTLAQKASILGYGLLVFYDIIPPEYLQNEEENPIYLKVEGGLSYREISGNIISENRLNDYYNIPQRRFLGLEIGTVIRFNKIRAGISLFHFFRRKNRPYIPDLHGWQILGGIALSSPIFKKELNR